ncbi:tetratricopeptide repeat-containing sensor histidine kinase [Pontibacter ruber]|uniref:histidine kinase n=1 Tax=Pontibacter ruber TaxID=1343895 RepID=A0ABW5CXH9_9BACT|nr:tetratricopeptide repeat-containing sensor histidine kinase [Pontibacter ruber]
MMLLVLTRLFLFLPLFGPQDKNIVKQSQAEQQTAVTDQKIENLLDVSKELRNSNPKAAVDSSKKAVVLAAKYGDKKALAKAYNSEGAGYYVLGDYEKAINLYYKALKIREQVRDSVGIGASYNNIANIHNSQAEYKKALPIYEKALSIATRTRDTTLLSGILNNIGNIHLAQENFDRSLAYYKRSLPLKEKLQDTQGILICLINIGIAYTGKGDHATALAYFNKALPYTEKINSLHDKVYILRGKAEAYLVAKQYDKALKDAHASLDLAKKYEGRDEIRITAALLDKIYTKTGNFVKAHEYLSLYTVYNDSIKNEQVANQIAQVQVKYETARKDKENLELKIEHKLHQEELEHKSIVQYFIIALLLLVCVVAFVFFRGRQRLRHINNMLTQKNELITQSNLALNEHQEVLTLQAAQLQKQKEELERLNGIKDKLFSVIAHDLRGPLVSLKGLLHVMAMGKVPADKQQQLFNSLVSGQQNVLWMLDNLFDWARAQMRGFEVNRVPIAIQELANENIRLLAPQAISKDIKLINHIAADPVALADKEMVRLVLRNLLSNGIKFCNIGGEVTLAATQKDGMLHISVEDTGIGMSEEVQQKLFGHSSYTSKGTANEKGSGLGLALCKDFVEQNGGTIRVVSTPGKGSRFEFTLPVAAIVSQNCDAPALSASEHELQLV